jgi:hypothetical protein
MRLQILTRDDRFRNDGRPDASLPWTVETAEEIDRILGDGTR